MPGFGSPINWMKKQVKRVILKDITGNDSLQILDADRTPVFKVDSKGNTSQRGKAGKFAPGQ